MEPYAEDLQAAKASIEEMADDMKKVVNRPDTLRPSSSLTLRPSSSLTLLHTSLLTLRPSSSLTLLPSSSLTLLHTSLLTLLPSSSLTLLPSSSLCSPVLLLSSASAVRSPTPASASSRPDEACIHRSCGASRKCSMCTRSAEREQPLAPPCRRNRSRPPYPFPLVSSRLLFPDAREAGREQEALSNVSHSWCGVRVLLTLLLVRSVQPRAPSSSRARSAPRAEVCSPAPQWEGLLSARTGRAGG
eukprot:21854-Rhodomonas_salina.3